jgi:hypothetical protein
MPLPKLVNGNFEFPRVPATQGLEFYLDASPPQPGDKVEHVPGWMTTATDRMIELWASGHEKVLAYEGRQFAELNANEVSTLYQDCVTEPGMTVQWGLSHRGRTGTDRMALLIGPPDAPVNQQEFADGTAWKRYEGSYTIPKGQTLTRFAFKSINVDPEVDPTTQSVGNFLDAIYFGEKHVAPIELPSIFSEEDIVSVRPPIDPTVGFSVMHHVSGEYLICNSSTPVAGDFIQIWYGAPGSWKTGRTWSFEQKPDGSYLISPTDLAAGDVRLYLQADPNISSTVQETLVYQKPRNATDPKIDELQSWLMQPVGGDISTYAIVPKKFPDHALGGGATAAEVGDVAAYVRHTLGGPTLFHYWRLAPAV